MNRVFLSALLLCCLVLPATRVLAQSPAAASDPLETPIVLAQAENPPIYTAAEPGGFAERTAQPRTLRAHWHVFVAFAITWVLLFAYAISVAQRFGRLDREITNLERGTLVR